MMASITSTGRPASARTGVSESLLFDHEAQMATRITEAVRDLGGDVAIDDAALAVLDEDLEDLYRDVESADDAGRAITMVRRFG